MTTKKQYEVLKSLPAYGPMYISITDDDEPFYSEGYPVRFYKSDNTEWVANFKLGWTGFNCIYELVDKNKLLVIAGGTCYIMNPDQTKPIAVFGANYITGIKTGDRRIVLQDQVDLTVIEANGEYWHSKRISWDRIKELKLEGSIVTGLAFDPMNDADIWIEFTYDIDSKTLIGGSYKEYDANKKPWWKLW